MLFIIQEAENGKEALEILRKNRDTICLILLDVVMPVMDGYTFLDIMMRDERLSLIPVIVMTQTSSEDAEISALSHGATDFVPKPYRPQVILHRIASILHLQETAAMVNQFRYDRLTRLYSKEFFFQKAQEILVRNPDREYNIVCSNIVNFKLYNDTFGIPAGDRLLKNFAAAIEDIQGEDCIAGRYSGDRFVCLQERGRENVQRAVFERSIRSDLPDDLRNVEIIRLRRCVWSVWVSGSSSDFFLLLLAHKLPHIAGHDPRCDQGGEKVGSGHGEPNAIELKQMGQQPKHGQEEEFEVIPLLLEFLTVLLEDRVQAVCHLLGDVGRNLLHVAVALQVAAAHVQWDIR